MKYLPGSSLRTFCALLLFVAALAVDSNAQINAVGYINKDLPPGFSLLTNPLRNIDNSVSNLLNPGIQNGVPDGLTVYLLQNGSFITATYDSSTGSFYPPEVAAEQIPPGRGFFVFNPTAQNLNLTFVGEVPQGTLINPLPGGFSLVGSMVPRTATPEQLKFPGEPGDKIYFFDAVTQNFQISILDELDHQWYPPLRAVAPAEGFVVLKASPAEWVQEFYINQIRPLAFPLLLL